jgi:phosphoribosyl 1,2-cyclic phosphate phosphodiesterase|tara:strand:+ start:11725 stop:12498 length:774 start_codon:yes stop_codon:yes gene_type:complete
MNFRFTLLGTGSSMGVPRPDGFFGNCDPKNKKNYRTRCSALISIGEYNVLIDTSPDLRQQLLAEKIKSIDEVLYTHMHADQTHGINDLRVFYLKKKKKIPVHCDNLTSKYLYSNFSYCFDKKYDYPAILLLKKLKKNFYIGYPKNKVNVKAIEVKHGLINSIAYIINNSIAYVSDANEIYQKDFKYLKGLNYLVIDCLRIKKHPSHFNLDQILTLVEIIKPKKTILTNLHSDLDYNQLLKILPNDILPGYDGLSFNI